MRRLRGLTCYPPPPPPPALQEPVYKLLPIWFVLLPRQSTKRVCPSAWPVVHGHVGSPEAMGGQAASWLQDHRLQLGSPPGWSRRPGVRPHLCRRGRWAGCLLPAIHFPHHQAALQTLESTLLHKGAHMNTQK